MPSKSKVAPLGRIYLIKSRREQIVEWFKEGKSIEWIQKQYFEPDQKRIREILHRYSIRLKAEKKSQ